MEPIRSYSHQKTNEKVLELVTREDVAGKKIVDIGAGEGYFCSLLGEHLRGKHSLEPSQVLQACDLNPDNFRYPEVVCSGIDGNGDLPFRESEFDCVTCIEVVEHLENQFRLLRELFRITKPGGRVIVTTPNLLNINSRLRYLHSGFWLLFDPLPLKSKEPVHLGGHVHPVTCYYLAYGFYRAGFSKVSIHFDRRKRSALFLSALFCLPMMIANRFYVGKLSKRNRFMDSDNLELLHNINSLDMLAGRTVIIEGIK